MSKNLLSLSDIKGLNGEHRKIAEKLFSKDSDLILCSDVLCYFPFRYIERIVCNSIDQIESGQICIVKAMVINYTKGSSSRGFVAILENNQCSFEVIYFSRQMRWLINKYPIGSEVLVSGKVDKFRNKIQFIHPDYFISSKGSIPLVEPVYRLCAGVSQKEVRNLIRTSCNLFFLSYKASWIQNSYDNSFNWPDFYCALGNIHCLTNQFEQFWSRGKVFKSNQRIIADKLYAALLVFSLMREHREEKEQRIYQIETLNHSLWETVRAKLPFQLTSGQEKAISQIVEDLGGNFYMRRILLGDVGCGKTIVAVAAMCHMLKKGNQVAFMVPTSILAEQHFDVLSRYFCGTDIKIGLLTGALKGKKKKQLLDEIEKGHCHLVIGTHALFQDSVKFSKLSFVVIDEQHRFGVNQRQFLLDKGGKSHFLLMSATPIPRTLAMSFYGDLKVSQIENIPKNRLEVTTVTIPLAKCDTLIEKIDIALKNGNKVYWICPSIDTASGKDSASVKQRYKYLTQVLGSDKVSLIHSKIKEDQRLKIFKDFSSGKVSLLVATTVIEVGVDVPDATIIIIEHAEQFGLAQLHQLRGRVGRGTKKSYCVLMYCNNCTSQAAKRLNAIRLMSNGYEIANLDLELRGSGDILGTIQSGSSFLETEVRQWLNESQLEFISKLSKETLSNIKSNSLSPNISKLFEFFGYNKEDYETEIVI